MTDETKRTLMDEERNKEIEALYKRYDAGQDYKKNCAAFREVLDKQGEHGYSWIYGRFVGFGDARDVRAIAAKGVLNEHDRKIMRTDQRAANHRANISLGVAIVSAFISAMAIVISAF